MGVPHASAGNNLVNTAERLPQEPTDFTSALRQNTLTTRLLDADVSVSQDLYNAYLPVLRPGNNPPTIKAPQAKRRHVSQPARDADKEVGLKVNHNLKKPLRYYCGEPGCEGYGTAEGNTKDPLASIRSHYSRFHKNVMFDEGKLVASRDGNQKSRPMTERDPVVS